MRSNCRRYPDATTAEADLADLAESGLARWVEPDTARQRGVPIKAVELCMTHDSDDTGPDATMLLSQPLYGTRQPKGFHFLAQVAQREIGVTLDEEQQQSS
jgi:hypothetical protein